MLKKHIIKISNSIELPKERETLDGKPKIGMTTEEVLNSTWGKPKKINKDTYSWGVKEQWYMTTDIYTLRMVL